VTSGGRLDPDVLTGQTDGLLGQQIINTERIWTDSSGKHKRLAKFVRIEGTQVILQNAQGRTTRVAIQSLSTADQLVVDQLRQISITGTSPSKQPRIATRS
jgi:SLA1 homology domain 1, SHD1